MRALGGGEVAMLESFSAFERRGGGIDDNWLSIQLIDRKFPNAHKFVHSDDELARRIGMPRACVTPASFDEGVRSMYHNLDANPGPSYTALGFRKKRDSVAIAMEVARHVVKQAESTPVVQYCKPRYALAGRSKLSEERSS